MSNSTPENIVLLGFLIGLVTSIVLLFGLPFAASFCFFIIGGESHPIGLIIFCIYAFVMLTAPFAGMIIGACYNPPARPDSTDACDLDDNWIE